jgi:anion-transporting  ArsA/GET3 family ATPase
VSGDGVSSGSSGRPGSAGSSGSGAGPAGPPAPAGPSGSSGPSGAAGFAELVRDRRILVCCGSGGVGKTTTAAVMALEAARLGRRAVVVTIDPAKRLADALGLAGLTDTPSRIDGDWSGELWATMLDTKSTFDNLVAKHAATPEQARRILANRFYRNISGALSGTQEYMAMEKLYELHEETDFDLVVVDTPPTRHALDFLDAPRRLARFLDHRLFRLLMAPSRGIVRAVNVAAQTFLRTVAKVVGGDVVDDAIAFFQAFEGMEEGFRQRAQRVNELLAAPETAFVLVASPRRDTVAEAHFFAERLSEAGIAVEGLVVNRVHPEFAAPSAGSSVSSSAGSSVSSSASATAAAALAERASTLDGTELAGLYRNLADFEEVASRERRHLAGLADAVAPAPLAWVPFLRSDVHDLDGMAEVAMHVFADVVPEPSRS